MRRIDSRNVRAYGEENQEALRSQRVTVIGSGLLAQMILGGLAGLSIGFTSFIDNSRIYSHTKDFLCDHKPTSLGQKKVHHIQKRLEHINQTVSFRGIYSPFVEAFIFPHTPNILVDATNNFLSKERSLHYALKYNIPFISVSSNEYTMKAASYTPSQNSYRLQATEPNLEALLMKEFANCPQGSFSSGIGAGLVCEEIRKHTFQTSEQDVPLSNTDLLSYNLYDTYRKNTCEHFHPQYYKSKKVLVVGAGGIGNFVGLQLALLGVGNISILDLDTVEDHNLNRQLLLYDRVGEHKARVLCERINDIDPEIKTTPLVAKIGAIHKERDAAWLSTLYECDKRLWERETEKFPETFYSYDEFVELYYTINERDPQEISLLHESELEKYDIIFGCFDNKYARLWLNDYAIRNQIPYIDGGTGISSGQLAVYVPGKTSCVDCELNVKNFKRERISCADQPSGSVVMANMIIGSAMVGEAVKIMYGIDNPLQGVFRYIANSPGRIGVSRSRARRNHSCTA